MVILSSPNVSAGAFTVIAENFEKVLVLHAVKKYLNLHEQMTEINF